MAGVLQDIPEGSKVALKSTHGKYLSAQPDGRAEWNRDHASDWEYFHLEKRQGGKVALKGSHGMYVSAQPDGSVQINREAAPLGGWEEFTVEDRGNDVVCLKSSHGKYLSAQQNGTAQWNRDHAPRGGWEDIQFMQQGATGQQQPATTTESMPPSVTVSGAGSSEVNGTYVFKPGKHENRHWDTIAGHYQHTQYPEIFIAFQDCGTAHQRPEWNKWMIISKIGVLYAAHTGGKIGVPPRDGEWETVDSWGNPGAPGGKHPAPLVNSSRAALISGSPKKAATKIQERAPARRQESIEILEAVTVKPVRFKINNRPSSNDAWVGIYPLSASDQDHGEENKRWKWLRNIDVNNASFPKQAEGDWSIRVFSDGGHTLHERKDFAVQAGKAEPRDPVAVQAIRKNAWIALVVGIIMFGIGLPLFIASGQENLGMLIPGAILFGVGAVSAGGAWFVLITSWSESYAETGKSAPRWTKVAVVFAVLLLIPGAALNIIGAISIGTLHHEETSSARLSITDTDGMGDQGFIIFIEAVPGDFDNNGIHDYCQIVIVNATHSGPWMSEPWTSQAKQNDADQTRQVFELEIAHDGSGCDANVWPQQKGDLVKLGRACYGCMAGYTEISASRNDNSTPIPMWIQDGEKVGEASGLTIAGGIISGLSVLSLIGLGIFHSKIKANRTHARKDTSADSSYSIQLEDMSFWDDITEGSEDNRSYHDKLLEKMKYPDKEEIEQDIQSGKSLQKWYSHWLHDPVKSAEIAKALGLVVGGAGYDFEGSWGTKGLYAYRSGKYSGHAYFGTGGSDEDRLEPEDDDDKYRPWDRNDPKTPENIRKIWLEIEPRLARSYYLDPPNDD